VDAESYFDAEIAKLKNGVALRSPAPHQSLFKYISLGNSNTSWERLQNTLSGTLTGSSASYLNDPFEISPVIIDDLRESTVNSATGAQDLLDRLQGKVNPLPDYLLLRQEADQYIKELQRKNRIISFSSRYDSPLLWAHYADGYKGACLHFFAGGLLGYRVRNLYFVNYSSYRKLYPLSLALTLSRRRDLNGLKTAESDHLLYYQKATEWAYEEEVRTIYDDENYSEGIPYSLDNLASIIVGPKTTSDTLDQLKEIVATSAIPNLAMFQAKISHSNFSVEVDFSSPLN
jgi:hypothetical protein